MTTRQAGATVPSGARLANTGTRPDIGGSTVRAASAGGVPYDPPTCTGRTKDDRPCGARRAQETLFCIGHLRGRANG